MDNPDLKPIPFNENYFARSDGTIWRMMSHRPRHKNQNPCCYKCVNGIWFRYLTPAFHGKYRNYLVVDTPFKKSHFVHRLILQTFYPVEGSEKMQVNHLDRNTFNNSVLNLEWCSNLENQLHRHRVPRLKSYEDLKKDFLRWQDDLFKSSDYFVPQTQGSWLFKYDKQAIIDELTKTSDTHKEIAARLKVPDSAIEYWQSVLKIERPRRRQLIDEVNDLLLDSPDLSASELAEILSKRVTSIHAVLRKRSRATTTEITQ